MLRSWDRFEIPHLFSRAVFYYGEPISVPRRLTPEESEAYRLQVEQTLNRMAEEAEQNFDALWNGAREGTG